MAMDEDTFWTGLVYKDERPTIHDRLTALEERVGRYDGLPDLLKQYK